MDLIDRSQGSIRRPRNDGISRQFAADIGQQFPTRHEQAPPKLARGGFVTFGSHRQKFHGLTHGVSNLTSANGG
jgi:hypothetical protein